MPTQQENVEVRFGANAGDVGQAAAQVRGWIEGLGAPIQAAAGAFAGLWVIDKVKDFADAVGRAVEEISALGEAAQRAAAMTGTTVEQIQELGKIGQLSGGSEEGMTQSIVRLERALASAGDEGSKLNQIFQNMGIQTREGGAFRDINSIMADLSQRFSEAPDGINKTAIAMELMGRSGAAMIPTLNQGRDGWEELRSKIEATRSVMSAATAAEFAQLHDSIELQKMSWDGLGITITNAFAPALGSVVRGMNELIQNFTASLEKGGAFKIILDALVTSFELIITVVAAFSTALQQLWQIALATTDAMTGLGYAMTFQGDKAAAYFEKAKNEMAEVGKLGKQWTDDFWNRGAFTRAQPGKTGGNNLDGMPDLAAQKEAEQAYIESIRAKQEANKEYYSEVMRLEDELLEYLRNKYGENSSAYQKELTRKLQMENRHLAQTKQQWSQAFSFISSDFKTAVSGWIDGSMTFGEAFTSMITSMATHFIEKVAEMIAEWLIFQAITAIFGGGGGGGGLLGSLIGFETGTTYVPRTGPYIVHEGEMVIPKEASDQIRAGKGAVGMQQGQPAQAGGGDNYSIVVQAIDTRTGTQFLMDNARGVAAAMKQSQRNFDSSIHPSWAG